jgi:hypothetical protein
VPRQADGASIDRAWKVEFARLGIDRVVREIERWRLEGKLFPPDATPSGRQERHLRLLDRLAGSDGFRGSSFRWVALILGGYGCPCEGLRQALTAAYGVDTDSLDQLPTAPAGSMEAHEQIERLAGRIASTSDRSASEVIRGMRVNLRRLRSGVDNLDPDGLIQVFLEDVASIALTGQPPPLGIDEHVMAAAMGLDLPAKAELPHPVKLSIQAAGRESPIMTALDLVTNAALERLAGPIPLVKIILERVAFPMWNVRVDDQDEIAGIAAAITPGFVSAQPGFLALVDALGGIDVLASALAHSIPYDPIEVQRVLAKPAEAPPLST